MFEVLVIGMGLIGTAAVRYLSQKTDNVAALGPAEPANWQTSDGVFASHYDQGRITQQLGKDLIWSTLAFRAINQYREIEARSGIRFYFPIGVLFVGPEDRQHPYWQNAEAIGQQFAVAYDELSTEELARQLSFLRFPPNFVGLLERPLAGYINPRDLIRAQITIAAQQGATIFRETAVAVTVHTNYLTIQTKKGSRYQTRKLLVATGGFSNCFDLLPAKLDLHLKTETTILAEISAAEAERMRGMPAIIYDIDSPELNGIYLLPPIRYPDGRLYLKMGCNTRADQILPHRLETIGHWFISGESDNVLPVMREALQAIIPGLEARSFATKRCLITYTPHGKPFIDAVRPNQIYVATGGNGSAAKSADAIGKLAADLTWHDVWQDDLDASHFQVRFADGLGR